MKITQLELFMVEPRWLFLKISTDEGLAGWGEPVVEGRAATVATAVQELEEYLIGRDPDQIEDIWQVLYRGGFYRGGPVMMSAIAGVDQALWDIKGQRYNLPVYQFLGGAVREKVRVYSWIGGKTPEDITKDAKAKLALGYNAIKMGATDQPMHYVDSAARVDEVVARVGAARDALGPKVGLGVDFHGKIHKPMAKVIAKELEPFHLLFIEEPVLPENNEALRDIAMTATVPIATGERMFSRWDFKKVLQDGYVSVLQPDLSHAGGISEVKKIAAMAEAYDVAVAPHCPLGPISFMACLQLDSATPNVIIQEQVVEVHDIHKSVPLKYLSNPEVFQFAEGFVAVPQGAGLGLKVNEAAVREAAKRGHNWKVPPLRNEDGTVAEW
jgi:galactonate dehydratase